MKYKIVADSSANLCTMEQVAFASVPLHIIVGEQEFVDDEAVDIQQMQEALTNYKGKTSTSCPSPEDWLNAFGDADVVFCITITSGLSGAHTSAVVAKDMLAESDPTRQIYIYDSLSTGPEMTLIAEKIKELLGQGLSAEQVDAQIKEYMKHTHLYFALASLDNFAKNGRINPIIAKGVGILGIRIVGAASEVGTLQPMDKKRGDAKAIPCLIDHMKKCGYTSGNIIISHSGNPTGAEQLKEAISQAFGSFHGKVMENRALCNYYAEPGSLLLGFEA